MSSHPMFTAFEPNVSFRYKLTIPDVNPLKPIDFLCKAISLPSIDQGEVVIDYYNTDFKVKGKSRWQDITLSIYDSVGRVGPSPNNEGAKEIHDWLLRHHNSSTGLDGWAYPAEPTGYKSLYKIQVLAPDGQPVYHWELHGAFMSAINFGSMDWAAEDAIIAEVTIKYDWAYHKPGGS